MAIIDQSGFNFCGETIRSLGQLIYDDYQEYQSLQNFVTIYSGIVVNRQIGFITDGSLVGVKNKGCSPQPQPYSIGTRAIEWEPKAWEILIFECWADLEGTIAALGLKKGVNRPNLVGTDYLRIVLTVLRRDVREFWWRLAWFNDEDAANVSAGGVITDGVSTEYFDILNGLWKQIFADATIPYVEITANSGATYADQEITVADAVSVLREMYRKAPTVLKSSRGAKFAVTQGIFDAMVDKLSGDGCDCTITNIQFENFQNGVQRIRYRGYPVEAVSEWTRSIEAYEDNGTTYNLPNRALFYTVNALGFGVDAVESFTVNKVWYENKDRGVYIEMMGLADAKVIAPNRIVKAY